MDNLDNAIFMRRGVPQDMKLCRKFGSAPGSVSKVEMATPIDLIYKVLFPSISTFETPPTDYWLVLVSALSA